MSLATLPREWDVVVVGAGIAGSVSAYRLARHGLRVLLVEKSAWPRDKACGGCLNAAALQALRDADLASVADIGPEYSRIRLASGRRQAMLGLPTGRAISRRRLDARLVECAEAAGVRFLSATQAVLEENDPATDEANAGAALPDPPLRPVTLRQAGERISVAARLVIGGDGLGSRLLREELPDALQVEANSRIGVGTTVADAPGFYHQGTIHMACGRHGYVGLVRVENGRLNIGAALDPGWMKQCGGPLPAVRHVLDEAGFASVEALDDANWQGTPQLTRRRTTLGAERVLILGDAAGYVEPFTGEGMGWALAGAAAIEPLALEAVNGWRSGLVEAWSARHAAAVRARQRGCRGVAMLLRRPRLMAGLLALVNVVPGAVAPFTVWLNRRYPTRALEDK